MAKNKTTYFIQRLTEEVGQEICFFNPWTDFELPQADKYIVRTTGVYGSDLDLMILKSFPQEKLINSIDSLKIFRSKKTQYEWFEDNNFPILPWLSVSDVDLITIEKFFRLYPEVIVKPKIGQGGWGIEALNWESFKKWKKKRGTDLNYLIQPFLKNCVEYRYFFIKGQSPIVLERMSKSSVAANFQKQGTAKMSELPHPLEAVVNRIILESKTFYGAIDLLVKDGDPYILELNTVPGIEQCEQVSERNVAREFKESLII